jgi:hypothetical protein
VDPAVFLSTSSCDTAATGIHTLNPEDILGNSGLSGLESAPVLPTPGQHPRIPGYIHTETGPPTGHLLPVESDPRAKAQPKTGRVVDPSSDAGAPSNRSPSRESDENGREGQFDFASPLFESEGTTSPGEGGDR